MKRLINLSVILLVFGILTSTAFAQEQNNQIRKVVKAQTLQGVSTQGPNWVDNDGDGICDNFGTDLQGQGQGAGKGYGLKDGSNGGTRPQDGTGFGKMNGAGSGIGNGTGTGICDDTGPKGSGRRSGRK